ncbi:MAG: hypothetical protein JW984_13990 [Deltaproteobacteria bacterium]|uniref:Uncharacterized protein n=1 Tax=Candidatus Zymogenus saltonus TaxID=2844893 RepID=A0A9D8KI26_9DELT|nr:hypothetical protein [Candidatus Zymogenus saltonus]
MKRSSKRSLFIIILFVLISLGLQFGCSKGCRNPKDCQGAIFNALSEGDKDKFFEYVLDPPENQEDRDLVFEWHKSRFEPYIGGEIVREDEVEGKIILSVSCSSDYADEHGTEAAAPLLLAFEDKDGWKLDLKYTERINDINSLFKGLF